MSLSFIILFPLACCFIIIIIIIDKTALFEPSVEDLPDLSIELDHPVFTSLDFATIKFLQSKVVRLASNPQPGELGMSPTHRVAQLYHQASGSLSVAFCDSQGYGGGILTRLHTVHVLYGREMPHSPRGLLFTYKEALRIKF
jgi:hypothetical protein